MNVIDSKTLLLCPCCKTHFPEIIKLTINDKKIEVIITCDHCSELHCRKAFELEKLLNAVKDDNNDRRYQQCWICENKSNIVDKMFCITCEKWICEMCYKLHDEYVKGDQIVRDVCYNEGMMHCFCDREIHIRQKCCIHHGIAPIVKQKMSNVNKGSMRSLINDNNENSNEGFKANLSQSVNINMNKMNGEINGISDKSDNVSINNESDDIMKQDNINNSSNVGSFTNTISTCKSQDYSNNIHSNSFISNQQNQLNNNENEINIDQTTVPFTTNITTNNDNNLSNSFSGTVYAIKHCSECNLFFCETCSIDHQALTSHIFDEKDYSYLKKHNHSSYKSSFTSEKQKFLELIANAIESLKSSNFNTPKNTSKSISQSEIINYSNNLESAYRLNEQLHSSFSSLFERITTTYEVIKKYGIYNESIINSYDKLCTTNKLPSLEEDIKDAKKFYQSLHVYLLTKFYFKTERITCFEDHIVYHNGVTAMIYFRERLYTGGKRILKKWKFPYTKKSSSTLLLTKEGDLTGRINCFCVASSTMILAGTDKGYILLCEFGKDSGIRITSTDRKLPILCMHLLSDEQKGIYRYTSFLLSDQSGIWEIAIESKGGKTMLSEVEFFKTKDEKGTNVSVRAILPAKGATSCFLIGGLDYIYPKFRGNTLIKIQDSIKCSETNKNKLISCMTYVEGTNILAVGGYDCGVGALVLSNPQQRSRYKEIARFTYGVVSIVSRKENEIIALSSAGEFKIINLFTCYNGMGFQWEEIGAFKCKSVPSVSLIPLQTGYIAICGKDQIEIWYAHV